MENNHHNLVWSGMVWSRVKVCQHLLSPREAMILLPNHSGGICPEGIIVVGQGLSGVMVVMVIEYDDVHNPHVIKQQCHTQSQWNDTSGRDCQMW